MLKALLTFAAPLVLLFALVMLTGAVTTLEALAGQAGTDACCRQVPETPEPLSGSECSDPGCGCLSCSVPVFFNNSLGSLTDSASQTRWFWSSTIPSPPVSSIDYPPELS